MPTPGWLSFQDAYQEPESFQPDGVTRVTDPLLLYFTSGTTAKPKLVLHSHQSYPVGCLSTLYWLGLQPGDVHWNISSPGWAKHAWSCLFAPWTAEATVFAHNYARFTAKGALEILTGKVHHHPVRSADRVAHAGAGGSRRASRCICARSSPPASR